MIGSKPFDGQGVLGFWKVQEYLIILWADQNIQISLLQLDNIINIKAYRMTQMDQVGFK